MVINVEYNQLDPLLKATGHPEGDANCETGYSPYPGNINQVIVKLDILVIPLAELAFIQLFFCLQIVFFICIIN